MQTKSSITVFYVVISIFSGKLSAQNNFQLSHSGMDNSITDIEWINLKVAYEANKTSLCWHLFSAMKIDYFTVESSEDEMQSFEEIARLEPKECHENNNDPSFKYQLNQDETKGNI